MKFCVPDWLSAGLHIKNDLKKKSRAKALLMKKHSSLSRKFAVLVDNTLPCQIRNITISVVEQFTQNPFGILT